MATTSLDPRHGAARGLRALVLTLACVAVAGFAHSYVDGCLDLRGLLLSAGLCWPAAVLVLGRRRQLPLLVSWAAAAQLLTHGVLAATCGGPAHPTPLRVLLGHAVAVLVTTALLARADTALWAVDAVRRALGRILLPLLVTVPPTRRVVRPRTHVRRLRALRVVSPRLVRGPPSGLLPLTP